MLESHELEGHTTNRTVGADFESNHLSGTSVTIKARHYPLGGTSSNGMSEQEVIIVQDILAACDGALAWGGETTPLKQSAFYLAVPPHDSRLKEFTDRSRKWRAYPGRGAGTVDAFIPSRMKAARQAVASRN